MPYRYVPMKAGRGSHRTQDVKEEGFALIDTAGRKVGVSETRSGAVKKAKNMKSSQRIYITRVLGYVDTKPQRGHSPRRFDTNPRALSHRKR